MNYQTIRKISATATATLLLAGAALAQEQQQDLATALTSGKAHLNLRYRFEGVDEEGFADNALASTLRVRLNYATGTWRDWSAFAEFDYVAALLFRDFNSGGGTSPGRTQYPVVADPDGADLNQLFLRYDGLADTSLAAGRQRYNIDNQRFVGAVGWRQNEQTFDSVSGVFKGLPNTELFYAYVWQVNRIYGERSPIGKDRNNTHLLNARIGLADGWTVTPYIYYIDNDDTPAFSTATVGARLAGKLAAGDGNIALIGELATQSDAANAPVDYRANYIYVDFLWTLQNGLALGIAFESLDGDQNTAGKAFRTPLATLHAFQGWADQFLTTPNAGVDDVFATVKYTYAKWNMQLTYHDFSAASGSAKWGDEFDLAVGRKLADRYGVLFKAALFDASDSPFVDVNKYWVMLTADF